MLDAADLPDDIAAPKAMLIAAQLREVRKDDRIERLEKLVAAFKQAAFGVNPRRPIPSNSISHWRTWKRPLLPSMPKMKPIAPLGSRSLNPVPPTAVLFPLIFLAWRRLSNRKA